MSYNIKLMLADLNQKLRLDPHNPDIYNNLACLYYRINQIDNAIYHFKRSLSINPNNWQGHFNLGNCYVKKNLTPEAMAHYKHSINLNPNNINAIQNLGLLLLDNKEFTEALPYLEKSYQTNKENQDNFEFIEHLADCYLQLGDTENATKYLKLATKINPSKESAQHNLAILYLREKNHQLAAKHFSAALKLNSQNHTAKHMLDSLKQANKKQTKNPPIQHITSLFDQYSGYYNSHVKEKLHYTLPEKFRKLYAKYRTTITAKNALDLGCGTGLCGTYFRDACINLIGTDASKKMLLEARKNNCYDLLVQSNLQNNNIFKNDYFDLIIAADMLPYFGELKNLFANLKDLLIKNTIPSNSNNNLFIFNIELEDPENNKKYNLKHVTRKITLSKKPKNIYYSLQSTGRYTHTIDYIENLANQFHYKILENITETIRLQEGNPVDGAIFVLTSY